MGVAEQSKREPPGPSAMYTLDTGAASFAAIAALVEEYGPIVHVRSTQRQAPSLIVIEPEAIAQVLVGNAGNYVKGVGFERVKMLLGNGIIVSDGAFWRRQRTMIQPGFSRSSVERLAGTMQACNRRLHETWRRLAGRGAELDLTAAMSGYALEVILRAIFGADFEAMLTEAGGHPFAFLSEDPARNLQVAVKFRGLRGLMQSIVDARRTRGRSDDDLLGRLMLARDKKSGEAMSDEELLDELMTLIIAGHETSAGTLNWAWYLLSRHPGVEQRVLEEITAACGGAEPGVEHLGGLGFTRQVLEETLRLYPPVWVFTRKAVDEDELCGYRVAAGTDVFISPYYAHRHRGFWNAPEDFRPERFADEALRTRNRYAFIPFSAGARRCIGEYFSFIEMQLHLATLLPLVRLRHLSGQPVELDPGVNLRTRHPIHMRMELRTGGGA